jgi:hypothetical protein
MLIGIARTSPLCIATSAIEANPQTTLKKRIAFTPFPQCIRRKEERVEPVK